MWISHCEWWIVIHTDLITGRVAKGWTLTHRSYNKPWVDRMLSRMKDDSFPFRNTIFDLNWKDKIWIFCLFKDSATVRSAVEQFPENIGIYIILSLLYFPDPLYWPYPRMGLARVVIYVHFILTFTVYFS